MSAHQSQPSEQRNQGGSSGWLQGIVITVVGGILASLGWFYVQNWVTPTDGRGPSTSAPSRSQPPTRPEEAAIFLDKLSGPVQTAVGVSGEGFEPNEQVVIRFHAEEAEYRPTGSSRGPSRSSRPGRSRCISRPRSSGSPEHSDASASRPRGSWCSMRP